MIKKSVVILFLLNSVILKGQTGLDLTLKGLEPEIAKAYVQPFSDNFTGALHQNQYSWLVHHEGFHLQIGLDVNVFTISEASWRFRANVTEDGNTFERELPSLLGEGNTHIASGEDLSEFLYPGGLELSSILVAVPQLRIGNLLGFDFGFRYANYDYGSKLGRIKIQGFNARYSFRDPETTSGIAASIAYDFAKFNVKETLSNTSHSVRAQIGYHCDRFQLGAHAGYIMGQGKIDYESLDQFSRTELKLNGYNSVIGGIGAGFRIWQIIAHTEFNILPTKSIGIGLAIFI